MADILARTTIDIGEFRKRARAGERPPAAVRVTRSGTPEVQAGRVVSFVFSDDSVDRMGDTIDARGWQLDQFAKNPVVLFGHDPTSVQNIIGRAPNVRVAGNQLLGGVEFAEASVNPNADIVYRMVKGGWLNAVSVGFAPREWKPNKTGGISFTKQELLEVSVVAVPANANAIVQARAAGINVDRLSFAAPSDSNILKRYLRNRGWSAHQISILFPTREQRIAEAYDLKRLADRACGR
jgi:HK97 family phage prohead protease